MSSEDEEGAAFGASEPEEDASAEAEDENDYDEEEEEEEEDDDDDSDDEDEDDDDDTNGVSNSAEEVDQTLSDQIEVTQHASDPVEIGVEDISDQADVAEYSLDQTVQEVESSLDQAALMETAAGVAGGILAAAAVDGEETEVVDTAAVGATVLGVSMEFLLGWIGMYTGYTTAEICEAVKQKTAARRCAFVDMLAEELSKDVGPASIFLCHCWSKRFYDTVMAVQEYFLEYPEVRMDDTYVWIDILCVNQHDLEDTFDDPDAAHERIEETQHIIESIGHTMIAMPVPMLLKDVELARQLNDDYESDEDSEDDIDPKTSILRRSWCLWEILCTDPQHLSVALFTNERRRFIKDLDTKPTNILVALRHAISCTVSESSSATDTDQLLQAFEKWHPVELGENAPEALGYDLVDERVRVSLCKWVAEEAWTLLMSKQKDIEREYENPFANSKLNGRQSLRNMLRQQAICMYKMTAAFKEEGMVSYAIEICSAMLKEHERFTGQLDYDQTTAANLCQLGSLLEESGSHRDALARYQTCLDMSRRILPEFVEDALLGIGHCTWHLGDRTSAIEAFEEIVEMNRKSLQARPSSNSRRSLANALNELGSHLREMGNPESTEKGILCLEEAMDLAVALYSEDESEDTIAGLRGLAHILWQSEKFADAAKYYEKLLVLQDLCAREGDEILIRKDVVDAELLEKGDDCSTDFRNLSRCLMNISEERPSALQEAAEFCRAAFDLDIRRHGSISPNTLKDLQLLADIELKRGNQERYQKLLDKISDIQIKMQCERMRTGPLLELREAHFLEFEQALPGLLGSVKATGKFEELAVGLTRLSLYYYSHGIVLKAIAYLGEATKMLMFALSIHECDERAEWRLPGLHRELRDNFVHLFQLFRNEERKGRGLGGTAETLIPHCSNFVKMVKFYYRNDMGSDNVVLALDVYGRLLNHANHKREALVVLEEGFALAEQIHGEMPNEQWLDMIQVLSSIYKALDEREKNMKLNERIVEMHMHLFSNSSRERYKERPAVLYQLAAAQLALVEKQADAKDQNSRSLCASAAHLLEQGISLLKEHVDDFLFGDAVEENIAILQRELARAYLMDGRNGDALEQMRQVIELHTLLYDEEDPDDQMSMKEDESFYDQIMQRVETAGNIESSPRRKARPAPAPSSGSAVPVTSPFPIVHDEEHEHEHEDDDEEDSDAKEDDVRHNALSQQTSTNHTFESQRDIINTDSTLREINTNGNFADATNSYVSTNLDTIPAKSTVSPSQDSEMPINSRGDGRDSMKKGPDAGFTQDQPLDVRVPDTPDFTKPHKLQVGEEAVSQRALDLNDSNGSTKLKGLPPQPCAISQGADSGVGHSPSSRLDEQDTDAGSPPLPTNLPPDLPMPAGPPRQVPSKSSTSCCIIS